MEWVETTAKTVDEARSAALDQLGVAADEAEFDVVEEPRPGLFGRLRGEARVRARVKPAPVRPKQERRRRSRRRSDGGGQDDGGGTAATGADAAGVERRTGTGSTGRDGVRRGRIDGGAGHHGRRSGPGSEATARRAVSSVGTSTPGAGHEPR
jgi:spoIIIJ-associated protein